MSVACRCNRVTRKTAPGPQSSERTAAASTRSTVLASRNHGRLRTHGMKKVAVFGNAGGGKSTLARRLAELTGLPLYPVDMMQFKTGGGEVPHEEYVAAHAELLRRDEWIIDGFGSCASGWERFAVADTLI